MRPSRFSLEEIAEIVKLRNQGARLNEICRKFGGIHHSFIQGVLRRNGLTTLPRMRLTGATLNAAISMYKLIKSSHKVAETFGVSSRTVLDAIHRDGVSFRERRKFDLTTEKTICNRYLNGESSTRLSRRLECSSELIFDILRRGNIAIRPKLKLSPQTVRLLPAQYAKGRSCKELGAIHGVSRTTIGTRLKEANVLIRDSRDQSRRKYVIDQAAFLNETEQSLYWLGFLMADGSVDENGTLAVHLQIGDRNHLYKLRSFLDSDAPVQRKYGNKGGYRAGAPYASFCVHCSALVEQLTTYGVTPIKSGRERLLRQQFSRHVWRGIIDGDGTLGFHKRGYFHLKLYGSYSICSQFRDFVLTLVPSCRVNVCKSRSIYSFGVCCGPARIVGTELYRGNNVALSRKTRIVRQLEVYDEQARASADRRIGRS
jgi:hypothetical protein